MKRIIFPLLLIGRLVAAEITPKDFSYLKDKMPKMHAKLLDIHLKLYKGYVAQVNYIDANIDKEEDPFLLQSMRKQYGFEYDGMRLHELYFEALGGDGKLQERQRIAYKITKEYKTLECFKSEVHSFAKTRGIGWIILFGNIENGDIKLSWVADHEKGLLAGYVPLLVIDLWEHAYISQFGLDKAKYIDLIFDYIDWGVVNARYVKECNTSKNTYIQYKRKS